MEQSINSVVSLTAPGTMKVKGALGQKKVVVLLGSGASHNFISAEMVQQLGLPMSSTTNCGVIMGTRLTVKGEGICRREALKLPRLLVEEDFLPLELGSSDVILGM